MAANSQVYFPGLNGLRFIAAIAVVITHIELIKGAFGFDHAWHNVVIFNLGGLGVYFFFVLSGFLITYLLLTEKDRQGTISAKKFYLRRIFRIWPLYYFILSLGFFILPHFSAIDIPYLEAEFHANYTSQLLLYLFILPNVAFSFYLAVPHIGQMWSIGVEEQFYIFWPLLIKYSRNILRSLILVFVFLVAVKIIYLFLPLQIKQHAFYQSIKRLLAMTKMELMAIGGIGAYFLYHKKESFLSVVYSKWLQLVSYIAVPLLIFLTPDKLQDGIHIVYSVFFLIIILNIGTNPGSFFKLNNSFFNYFGNISFGIYMYHLIIIPICLVALRSLGLHESSLFNVYVYTLVILSTLGISAVSYKYLEKPFITLKKKFEIVRSGGSRE